MTTKLSNGGTLLPSLDQTGAVDTYIQNRQAQIGPDMSVSIDSRLRFWAEHGVNSPAYKRMIAVGRTLVAHRSPIREIRVAGGPQALMHLIELADPFQRQH